MILFFLVEVCKLDKWSTWDDTRYIPRDPARIGKQEQTWKGGFYPKQTRSKGGAKGVAAPSAGLEGSAFLPTI